MDGNEKLLHESIETLKSYLRFFFFSNLEVIEKKNLAWLKKKLNTSLPVYTEAYYIHLPNKKMSVFSCNYFFFSNKFFCPALFFVQIYSVFRTIFFPPSNRR